MKMKHNETNKTTIKRLFIGIIGVSKPCWQLLESWYELQGLAYTRASVKIGQTTLPQSAHCTTIFVCSLMKRNRFYQVRDIHMILHAGQIWEARLGVSSDLSPFSWHQLDWTKEGLSPSMPMKEKTLSAVHFLACRTIYWNIWRLNFSFLPSTTRSKCINQDTTSVSSQLGSNSLYPLWTAVVVYLRAHKPSFI